jgi:hypothetical protein
VNVRGEYMSAERPNQSTSGATVLLVGLSVDVLARISEIVAPCSVNARMTSIAKLHEDTSKFRPFIVLVDSYLYDFDPQAFEKLARTANVKLGVISNIKEAETLVQRILQARTAGAPPATSRKNSTPPPARRQEMETAKYDAKTLHEALGRMGAKRAEFDTAKYDAKTLSDALERMSTKRLESQTNDPTAAPSSVMAPESPRLNSMSDTMQYDARTLEAMLAEIEAKRAESKTAVYDAREVLAQIAQMDGKNES